MNAPENRPAVGSRVAIPGTTATVVIVRYYSHTREVLVRYGNMSTGTKTLTQLNLQ